MKTQYIDVSNRRLGKSYYDNHPKFDNAVDPESLAVEYALSYLEAMRVIDMHGNF